ncbi:MAG: hypothetical protein M5U05_19510 [Anaerolineales bacterium]|nr:hypothetical protein [Anaerolineales bacterium]
MNINRQSDIPHAPYYVVCDDPFLSGWGPARQRDIAQFGVKGNPDFLQIKALAFPI